MYDIKLEGGKLNKEFVPGERYYQATADVNAESVGVIVTSSEGTKITLNSNAANSGEITVIPLREKGYGYTTVEISVQREDGTEPENFTLAVLKPAPDKEALYSRNNRPQFHYTAPYGFINDPNGMLYNANTGEYHFFYQAYPYGIRGLSKHWGHAVTKDLVYFDEKPTALYPDKNGDMWSGSGIIDYDNTAGLYEDTTPPEERMVLIYYAYKDSGTSAGLAYTKDGGETWIKERDGNGDIKLLTFVGMEPEHIDPKVFYLEKESIWVLLTAWGRLYTSEDLHTWKFNSSTEGWECPDIYEIRVEETDEVKWVRTYGGSFYYVGDFVKNPDGTLEFVKECGPLLYNGDSHELNDTVRIAEWIAGYKGVVYATQHFKDAPDNRIIAMSWLREQYTKRIDSSMTWTGIMTVPVEQKLRKKGDGYLLYSYPVENLKYLRKDKIFSAQGTPVTPQGKNILDSVNTAFADIEGRFRIGEDVTEFGFNLRVGGDGGITVKYDVTNKLLVFDPSKSGDDTYCLKRTMKMELPEDRTIDLRILLDNVVIESYGNNGEAYISSVYLIPEDLKGMDLYSKGGSVWVESLDIFSMNPSWNRL